MGTMFMGFHYNEGKKIGYDITSDSITIHNVSYADKNRIIRELEYYGHKNVTATRVENF